MTEKSKKNAQAMPFQGSIYDATFTTLENNAAQGQGSSEILSTDSTSSTEDHRKAYQHALTVYINQD